MKKFLDNHVEKIGFLIVPSLALLTYFDLAIGKILSIIFLSIVGLYLFYSFLKDYGWKIYWEKNLNKTTFKIQIPNLNLYNVFFYPIFFSSVVLWIVTGIISDLKYLSDEFFYSIFILVAM